jgi:hypothetical protein
MTDLKDVQHLTQLDGSNALIITGQPKGSAGSTSLQTIALP